MYLTELSKRKFTELSLQNKDASSSFAQYKKRNVRVKVKRSSTRTAAEDAALSAMLAGYQFDHSDAHVKEVARQLVQSIPSYEEEIQVK